MTLTGNYLKFQDLVLFYLTFYGFVACTRVNIIICELIKNVIQYCIIKEKRLMVTGQDLLLFFKTGMCMYIIEKRCMCSSARIQMYAIIKDNNIIISQTWSFEHLFIFYITTGRTTANANRSRDVSPTIGNDLRSECTLCEFHAYVDGG